MTKDLTKIFGEIDTFLYRYKEGVQNEKTSTGGTNNELGKTDDKNHVGIMAQELRDNPLTKDCVIEDENGHLEVDTNRLTLTIAGVLAQLCKKVEELEKVVKA